MLTIYDTSGHKLTERTGIGEVRDATVWIDLIDPTPEEDDWVENQLGISIPTRAEMREIEMSSRLYQENGVLYMTALVVYNADAPSPSTSTLTFILTGRRVVTVRYVALKAFPLYLSRLEKGDATCSNGAHVMAGLTEAIVHRAADLVERIQDEVEKLAPAVFAIKGGQQTRTRRLDVSLRTIGKEGDMTSRAQEAAFSIDRVLQFFVHAARERKEEPALVHRIEVTHRDALSILEHLRFLANRIQFLLDATLGMINIEQNGIIKIFSVASVALMPPTLIASIYGMNFKHMPELAWPWGYPLAVAAMVLSAMLPFVYFRRKGWF